MIQSNKPIGAKSRVAESLVAMSIAALVLVGVAHPGAAKGPSSATLSGPGIDPPIDLIATSDSSLMHEIMEQTGLWFSPTVPLLFEPASADLGPRYTLSWVNSGPPNLSEDERTIHQYIYAHVDLGLVIHTPEQAGLSGWGGGVTGWFDAPPGLHETMIELGIDIQGAGESNKAMAPNEVGGPSSRVVPVRVDTALQPGDPAASESSQNAGSSAAIYIGVLGTIVAAIALAAVTARRARLAARSSHPVDRDSR